MTYRPRHSCDALPLFHAEPDVWNSLDRPTQEQVLDWLSVLLLRELQRGARSTAEERTFTKGTQK